MTKLKLTADYWNPPRGIAWKKGAVVEVEPDMAIWLRADSPGTFVPVDDEPEPKRRTTAAAEPKSDEPKPKRRTTRRKSG